MKFLYLTDTHYRPKNPISRTDIYAEALLNKFRDINDAIKEHDIDYVLHGGDLFDIPRVSPEFTGQIVEIIKQSKVPWMVVIGNHDVYGHTMDTVNQTMLGLMAKSGIINLLTRQSAITIKDKGFNISLQGQEYYADIDKDNVADYDVIYNKKCKYHILVAHGMLLDKPFHPDVRHTLIENIDSKADMILVGHFHPGYEPQVKGKTTVINPGSTARVKGSNSYKRIPQFVVIDVNDNGIEYNMYPYKSAKPAEDILIFNNKELEKSDIINITKFKTLLQSEIKVSKNKEVIDILNDLNIDKELINETLDVIANTQISKDDLVPKLDGYIESADRIYITNIKANNFMCYKDLNINFDSGLNVITGESNGGKSTVLRLIKWIQYGEPRGSEMISHWVNSVYGSITYSNGYTITRERSKKDTGKCEILDSDGNIVSSFKGVKDNPIDIMNIHQMPLIYFNKDEKRNIAFADQLETSFLITESSAIRASAIGRLIGLQNVDASIRALNSEVKGLNKELNIKENLLNTEKLKLSLFSNLNNELKHIEDLQLLIDKAKEIEDIVNKLINLDTTLDTIDNKHSITSNELSKLIQILPSEKQLNKIEVLNNSIKDLNDINTSLDFCNSKIEDININLNILPNIQLIEVLLNNTIKINNSLDLLTNIDNTIITINKNTKSITNNLNKLSIAGIDSLINKAEEINDLKDRLEPLSIDIIQNYNKRQDINKHLINTQHELNNIDTLILETIGSNCECPTCGQVVDVNVIKNVI